MGYPEGVNRILLAALAALHLAAPVSAGVVATAGQAAHAWAAPATGAVFSPGIGLIGGAPAVVAGPSVSVIPFLPSPAISAVQWRAPASVPVPLGPAFIEPVAWGSIESVRALAEGISREKTPVAGEAPLAEAFDGRARSAAADAAVRADSPVPVWKDDRELDIYGALTGLDIPAELSGGGLWVDVGAGRGEAISAMAGRKGVQLVAVNAHQAYEAEGAENVYAMIPEDKVVARRYAGRARVVTDVYGAASYADDAVAALVYETHLLAGRGKLSVVTRPERFGTPETWKRIEAFFESRGRRARFELVDYPSRDGRKHGSATKALRVTVSGRGRGGESLDEALAEARRLIGAPVKIKTLYATEGAELWALDYRLAAP